MRQPHARSLRTSPRHRLPSQLLQVHGPLVLKDLFVIRLLIVSFRTVDWLLLLNSFPSRVQTANNSHYVKLITFDV